MSVLVFVEHSNGKVKKASLEAASYAAATAIKMGKEAHAVALGSVSADELSTLGQYGITKVHHVNNGQLDNLDAKVYNNVLAAAAEQCGAEVLIFSHNYTGKTIAAMLSARLKAGLVPLAVELPEMDNGFVVKRSCYSGKAFSHVKVNTPTKIVSINPNSYSINKGEGSATVEAMDIPVGAASVTVKEVKKVSDKIPLSEAELVVSAGRGLRGPENWDMIEEMAEILGAATACSRAVADVDWRPHHEHVGQTGLTVRPNLYIAIAISGAIQHLAGVNSSKVIVVINKDPEAPFFKAADYGIVGDAFEVVPKMNEALHKLKASA